MPLTSLIRLRHVHRSRSAVRIAVVQFESAQSRSTKSTHPDEWTGPSLTLHLMGPGKTAQAECYRRFDLSS
jgi:hypothetical protein